ncbi:hypothetical protein EX30DRAFT_327394 [Ascodesmis nigricans]|uniref:RING-type domain-containing protein n=1 Tax=Ascodesmis nigricans TaxID=341454 RepID=A0A4S2N439_9PEZI|nr:hypothetical protein EX30DRAFT_327394 [Ascodesmis nigricans]
MAHSKRNTSLAFFTSYERSLLKGDYGLQRTRLTRDSFKPFDACNLCLMRSRNPVSCPAGDLFCRECAVENLLSQRKEIARMQKEVDRRVKEEEEERRDREEEARERAVREFELLQMGLEVKGMGGSRREIVGRGEKGKVVVEETVEGEGNGKKRKFELDEEELKRIAMEETRKVKVKVEEEKAALSAKKLPSFWVPSLTPSVADTDLPAKPLKLKPVCPASTKDKLHHYSLKALIDVHFTEEADEKTKHGDPQRICPSCKKVLSNANKAMLARCGHVLCKPCADRFMTPRDDPHDKKANIVMCYVCDTKVKHGLIQIQSDGTGFSAGGGNVTTERQGIAFQC